MSDLVERLHERAESYRQSGPSAEHTAVMLEQAASRISQQDAELERMRREVEEANAKIAKTRDLISWAQSDLLAEARKAAFIDAAEIATATGTDAENDWPGETWIADRIATALRAKAEETGRG